MGSWDYVLGWIPFRRKVIFWNSRSSTGHDNTEENYAHIFTNIFSIRDTAWESDHFSLHFLSLTGGPNWPLRCLVYDIPSKPLHQWQQRNRGQAKVKGSFKWGWGFWLSFWRTNCDFIRTAAALNRAVSRFTRFLCQAFLRGSAGPQWSYDACFR